MFFQIFHLLKAPNYKFIIIHLDLRKFPLNEVLIRVCS